MLSTKIDLLWEKPCEAVQLQALPAPEVVSGLSALQDEIEADAPLALRRIPPLVLHSTILTLLHPVARFDRSKFEIWREHAEQWATAISRIVARTPTFELRFDRLICSEMAIIVKAEVPPVLYQLRQELSQAIEYNGWHPKPPDIAHITLFRYGEVAPVPSLQQEGLARLLPFRMSVSELRLIKERVYPTLQHDIISTVQLAPSGARHAER